MKLTQNYVSFINLCINRLASLRLSSLVNTIPRYLKFSTCCSVLPLTCSVHCLGFIERHNTSIFFVLIFVPAQSHAAETDRVHAEDHVEKMLAVPNCPQKVSG